MAIVRVEQEFGTAGSDVTVRRASDNSLALLFTSNAGTTSLANPVKVRGNGWVFFSVEEGSIVLVESGEGTNRATLQVPVAVQGQLLTSPSPAPANGIVLVWDAAGARVRAAQRAAALTAADAAVVDATYGAEESGVISNLRTRVNQLESALRAAGLLT